MTDTQRQLAQKNDRSQKNDHSQKTTVTDYQPQYLIIGQGGIGLAVTNDLAKKGYLVTGLARRHRDDYELHQNAKHIQADALTLDATVLADFTHIAIIITPDRYDANAYRDAYLAVAKHLANMAMALPKLERMVFISSTGVYGQDDGEWVDVLTKPKMPNHAGSAYILQAEQALQQAFKDQAVIIRPSGIYGKTRRRLIEQAKQSLNDKHHREMNASSTKTSTTKDCPQTIHWTNRIMDSDLVTVVVNVLTLAKSEPLYLASDYAPVSKTVLMTWLKQCLAKNSNTNHSNTNHGNDTDTTDHQTPTQYQDKTHQNMTGKRIHSNIPRAWLQYPDWQSGYAYLLADDKTR